MLMRHLLVILWIKVSSPFFSLQVSDIIEKEELHYPDYESSDSKRQYHSMTRGMIINEIIRRIDPKVSF